MDLILLIAGIGILTLVTLDIISTILLMNGGGVISNYVSRGIWKIFYNLGNRNARSSILSKAGVSILISLFAVWILLIWTGFSLIYLYDNGSVVDTSSEVKANTIGKIYFVGYTISSLGNGDLKSGSDSWRLFSNVMSMYGTFFITLSISYLIPVLNAVINKRALSGYIYQLGKTPEEILKNGWNGKDFSLLYSHFNNLYSKILEHSERHLAYPVLQYFHSTIPKYSAPLTFTILDEALTIQRAMEIDQSPNARNWQILQETLDSFIGVAEKFNTAEKKTEPPFPYPDNNLNFPSHKTREEISETLSEVAERRKILHGIIVRDGWKWEDVVNNK